MGDKIGNRRGCLEPSVHCAAAAAIAAVLALVGAARADDYPSRSVHVIIPFGPGGVTDIVSRVLFDAMAKVLGQTIVIENRAGASGTIATEFVADVPPIRSWSMTPRVRLRLASASMRRAVSIR